MCDERPVNGVGSPFVRAACSRLGGGLLGATLAAGLGAAVEATWVRAASSDPPSWGQVLRVTFALAMVVAPLIAFVAAVSATYLHGTQPAFKRIREASGTLPDAARAQLTGALLGGGVGLGVALLLGGKVALGGLASELAPRAAGAIVALRFVAVAVVVALASTAIGAVAGARVPVRLRKPWLGALVGLLGAALLLLVAVGLGNPGGEGGVLGMYGVLKRPELDLRLPGLLLFVLGGAYALAVFVPRVAFLALLAVPIATVPLAATSWLESPSIALAIEREAPLGRGVLKLLRRHGDADGDGFSRMYGHGDCDDTDAQIFPGADDVAGNGIDEDCSGEDDAVVVLAEPPRPEPTSAEIRQAWIAEHLPAKLNVVLLSVDTLRHDLGFAGYERPVSPAMDALARRSVVFERAYSLASYTGKSIGPTLIGRYPSETHRNWNHFDSFGKESVFVQERLQKAGVRTVSVQGHWYFDRNTGLGRGFDELDMSASPASPQQAGDRTVNSDELSDAALAQLSKPEMAQRQFFMWVHYLDPHAEYVAHPEYDFGKDERARYDGEVAFTDHHLGRVVDAIGKAPFAERTAIVVTSDHGEAFREHGMIRHGFEVWEELVRVPWIVFVPGVTPRREPLRRSLIDLAPTIAQLMGFPIDEGEVSGVSLVDDVLLPPGHTPASRIVFVDMAEGPHNAERQAFIEGDMKLIATSGRPIGLYDLKTDPQEKKDLLEDAERAKPIIARFKAKRRSLEVVRPRK